MDSEKLLNVCGQIVKLMDLHRKSGELMRKMIFSVAAEHLKQNEVSQTLYERDLTVSALRMWIGETDKFLISDHVCYFSKRNWPTHMRLFDLKPVRITKNVDVLGVPTGSINVLELRGKRLDIISPSTLEKEYVQIREEENIG